MELDNVVWITPEAIPAIPIVVESDGEVLHCGKIIRNHT